MSKLKVKTKVERVVEDQYTILSQRTLDYWKLMQRYNHSDKTLTVETAINSLNDIINKTNPSALVTRRASRFLHFIVTGESREAL